MENEEFLKFSVDFKNMLGTTMLVRTLEKLSEIFKENNELLSKISEYKLNNICYFLLVLTVLNLIF